MGNGCEMKCQTKFMEDEMSGGDACYIHYQGDVDKTMPKFLILDAGKFDHLLAAECSMLA